ncbi:branched-chain amino acid aminotransferase [Paenibacillus segetis]|uniref:Branched-chain-amino-acid aminotransferase n=1 Tax=Paenibacillus segetis TaxID=1325360 RepID=A0ABQ1YGU1_9BACL|nr:branched-chain amino acid aminotransferase [Paenibacillus segetis]GGH23801.1 branched-chain-amino-acid aminotransferase 2 [Paenibacillus segetis]
MMSELKINLSDNRKDKPASDKLGFGKYFTDHMFIMDYTDENGWHDARIVPYGPIALDPSAMVLHYGQEVFEGMKAYRTPQEEIVMFRPDMNLQRLNNSCERMSMPQVDTQFVLEAIAKLVEIDQEWIPDGEENALYIRPFMIATEPALGVRASKEYKFMVILSPVGAYYPEGIHPVSIYVEQQFVRAVRGGTGEVKTSGNYASGIKAQEVAKTKGFSQVLWLDGKEHKYIEEVGSMNVFFKVNGEIITPALTGSILPGVTRDSVITLLQDWGYPVIERVISVEELFEASAQGLLEEAFGTGTAAVISPIGSLSLGDLNIEISGGKTGELSQRLYDTITALQRGQLEDSHNWAFKVK